MALPALERLRQSRPETHLALLTHSKLADLFLHHPAIDEVLSFSKEDGVFAVARRLRARGYDCALILPNSFRTALEACLAGIKSRIGYGGGGRDFLLTRVVSRRPAETRMHKRSDREVRRLLDQQPARDRDRFPPPAHHIYNYLHLTASLGADPEPLPPRLVVAPAEREDFRRKFGIAAHRRLFGLNPGAEYGPAKRWPLDHFVQAAKLVEKSLKCEWLIFGGPGDVEATGTLARELGSSAKNLAGRTTLRELCVGLSLCDLILTNDTGPMHLAAAVGRRVVAPFGSTAPDLTGPWTPEAGRHALLVGTAPCAPCFRRTCPIDFRCMISITPEAVAQAICRLAQ